jgi:hypothetical protein
MDDEVDVLCGARRAVIRAGKLTRKHVGNPSLIKRQDNSLEYILDAHRSQAGKGAGKNARLNNSRAICASVQSG